MKEFKGYQADDGSIHEKAFDAAKIDFRNHASILVENEGIANKIADKIESDLNGAKALRKLLDDMIIHHPAHPVAAPPCAAMLIRCMGGNRCSHQPGTCTAKKDVV